MPVCLGVALAFCASEERPARPVSQAAAPSATLTTSAPANPVAPLPSASASPIPISGYDVPGWAEAIAQVEEKRGSAGALEVPGELRHAADRRLFLAAQLADAHERAVQPPHDEASLAQMIQGGQLVELAPMTDDSILYEVGMDAREDPLTHFDEPSGADVPLFGSSAEYEAEDARLAQLEAGSGPDATRARTDRQRLTSFYRDPARRDALFAEHAAVTGLAANFGGYSYDLRNPDHRARFQVRLLSHLHPAARDAALELARSYRGRFGRRLPLTSLVRTQRYQQRLRRVNRNATTLDLPPHSTGRAFDVSYKFMPPDEQNFVMDEIARMEAAGRAQALRERLNHIHVYVFDDGAPPSETLVAAFFDEVEEAHPGSAPRTTVSAAKTTGKARVASARKQATRKKAVKKAPAPRKASASRARKTRAARRR